MKISSSDRRRSRDSTGGRGRRCCLHVHGRRSTCAERRFHIINLIGRLTKDPELKKLGDSDRDVCELRLAVDNGRSRDGEDRDPTFIDIASFDAPARACAEHLTKGRQVAISGRLVYREWEAEDGSRRSKHSVIGRVEFLGSAQNGSATPSRPVADAAVGAAEEEIAF